MDTDRTDNRRDDITPLDERRLSPMARRVLANKAEARRVGGERPTGADGTSDVSGKAA